MKGDIMENQETIIPRKLEKNVNGVALQCAPMGEFVNKEGKLIKYPNRFKVGNGFKTIADLRSQDQVNAIAKILNSPKFKEWIESNLPQSTSDVDSEVDE
jgi:hypothetical protein